MTARRVLLPILVYSSLAPDEVAQRIPASPGVGHLSKPASPEGLAEAVQKLLGDA
jgi:CheY-like chemotaxis protein